MEQSLCVGSFKYRNVGIDIQRPNSSNEAMEPELSRLSGENITGYNTSAIEQQLGLGIDHSIQ
jgi:hypothetical protein